MNRGQKVALGAAVLVLALGVASQQPWKTTTAATAERIRHRPQAAPAAGPVAKERPIPFPGPSDPSIKDEWTALLKWLKSTPTPTEEEVRSRLLAIRLAWTQLDPQERAAAIAEILASGIDASTGLDFEVGLHGQLAGWPTLRVFLLDILATADPEMATTTASQVLDSTLSADEFATALKSLTREGIARADDSALLDRFDQMLGRPDWQTSRGFAEAFDLARFIGTPEAARRLTTWQGNAALKSMAMDEFAAEHPEAIMEILAADSPVVGSPRASIMARADPSQITQLDSVDDYVRRPDLSPAEATTFLKSFPLRSATTGFRLYGETPAPYTFEQIKAGDLAAAQLVENWIADPALEKLRPELQSLQTRLTKWVEQAK
jgi:hypothetical protein